MSIYTIPIKTNLKTKLVLEEIHFKYARFGYLHDARCIAADIGPIEHTYNVLIFKKKTVVTLYVFVISICSSVICCHTSACN